MTLVVLSLFWSIKLIIDIVVSISAVKNYLCQHKVQNFFLVFTIDVDLWSGSLVLFNNVYVI